MLVWMTKILISKDQLDAKAPINDILQFLRTILALTAASGMK